MPRDRWYTDEGVCARVEGYGKAGMGRAEIALELERSRAEIEKGEKDSARFRVALQRARDFELGWWERQGRLGIEGKLNATLWVKAMAGRFADEGYGDRGGPAGRDPEPGEAAPEPSLHDRARAVAALLAEAGMELELE